MNQSRPSLLLSTCVVALVAGFWGYLRLFEFREAVLPITFVLPLLLGVWTGRRWQLWSMAGLFIVMATVKVVWILPADAFGPRSNLVYLGGTLFNIAVGAIVVQAIISLRERLEQRNALVSAQNSELEAQAEELLQQNEEIKAQSEELAEQNEEIETQSEEVTRQNEDLVDLNARLSGREAILQGLLQSSRERDSIAEMLEELCRRALSVIGAPAAAVAILERKEDAFFLQSRAQMEDEPSIPEVWPLAGSIGEVVVREKKTAYVSDLTQRQDLAQPFAPGFSVRSVLATPLELPNGTVNLLVAVSVAPGHWTEEQFRVIEWVAAQCGLMMETFYGQQKLAEHAEALEIANRAKDRFLAMLSHELRTPLTPVLAAAGSLESDSRLPDDVREDLRMIHRNAAIQSRLIDDLLDLTRISRGKVELDRQNVSVATLLKDAVGIVSGDLDAKSQNLQVDFHGIDGVAVAGDGARLQQVFWNLLKNAIKFSAAGAEIQLRAASRGGRVRVEIQDRGAGIDPKDRERIFLPFEQTLTEYRRASEGGLGLGLAIAKAIVEMHDGMIYAQSDGLGHGATFTVELPAFSPESSESSTTKQVHSAAAAGNGKALRILLVEDHGDTGQILKRLLQSSGFDVEHAETASSGWKYFQEQSFDLVVSDLGLPDESGLDLMRRMRTHRPEIRGICLSGYGMEEDISECRKAGFLEHLTKPVDIDRLKNAILRAVSKSAYEG
jgi:signal transduction histidine kinase/ActR/RegA family two-component response regulator